MDEFDEEDDTAPVDPAASPTDEVPVPQVDDRISSEFEVPPVHRSPEKRRAVMMRAITESKLN